MQDMCHAGHVLCRTCATQDMRHEMQPPVWHVCSTDLERGMAEGGEDAGYVSKCKQGCSELVNPFAKEL